MGKKEKLNPRQLAFVQEYLIDRNATRAAIAAGYSEKTAKEQASRLLTNVNVDRVVTSEIKRLEEKLRVSRERNLKELARLAYMDPRDLFDDKGRLIPVHELSRDAAACLTGVNVKEFYDKKGRGKKGAATAILKKIKFSDKRAAIEAINKMQGYNIEKPEGDMHFHITWGGGQKAIEDKPIDVTPESTPLPANLNKISESEEE